jgi:hypothetical protein
LAKQTPPPSSSADHHHQNPQKRESRTQKLQLFFNSSKTPIPKFCTQGLLRHKHAYLSTSLSQNSYTSPTTHNHHFAFFTVKPKSGSAELDFISLHLFLHQPAALQVHALQLVFGFG